MGSLGLTCFPRKVSNPQIYLHGGSGMHILGGILYKEMLRVEIELYRSKIWSAHSHLSLTGPNISCSCSTSQSPHRESCTCPCLFRSPCQVSAPGPFMGRSLRPTTQPCFTTLTPRWESISLTWQSLSLSVVSSPNQCNHGMWHIHPAAVLSQHLCPQSRLRPEGQGRLVTKGRIGRGGGPTLAS